MGTRVPRGRAVVREAAGLRRAVNRRIKTSTIIHITMVKHTKEQPKKLLPDVMKEYDAVFSLHLSDGFANKRGWRVQHVRCKDREPAFTSFGEAVGGEEVETQ